jgi:ketosteroid isomerase-like protein
MDNHLESFREFMHTREGAAKAYVKGDSSLLEQVSERSEPATLFGPRGDRQQGAEKVTSVYNRDAALFKAGETSIEVLQLNASSEIAYWAGIQRATVKVEGKEDPVEFNLRVTELFRLERGEWKLVHRHADQLRGESNQISS